MAKDETTEVDRAELLEWRRLASEDVRADMRADSDLASALAEARAELERLRRVEAAADALIQAGAAVDAAHAAPSGAAIKSALLDLGAAHDALRAALRGET